MRCSDGQLSWREQGHRREPGQVDSFFLGRVREEGPSERNVRAIGVAWGKARDKTTGLRLDLVQRELHGRQVGPREMRGQVFRRGEQRRQVRAGSHGGQNKRLVTRRAVTPMDPLPTRDPHGPAHGPAPRLPRPCCPASLRLTLPGLLLRHPPLQAHSHRHRQRLLLLPLGLRLRRVPLRSNQRRRQVQGAQEQQASPSLR